MKKLYKLVLMLTFLFQVMGIQSAWAEWIPDGIPVCTAVGDQGGPYPVPDGEGGVIIAWQDFRDGNYDIYSQRVDALGNVLWAANGVAICTATEEQENHRLVSDGAGGAIITWDDTRSGNHDIYAQRVDASGSVLWTADGVAICTATMDQGNPQLVSNGAGGAIITWDDTRSGNMDIYAQRVNANGSVPWTADGVAICTTDTMQQGNPQLVSDGAGGAIITWGSNLPIVPFVHDIYAQRVNASGSVLWTANGVAICTATGDQPWPELVSDGAGGAIITWDDNRSGNSSDIYAQRVNANGSVPWTADGVAICTAMEGAGAAELVSDGAGGAIITWNDNRSRNLDIYAQKVNANGSVLWTADGVAICTATSYKGSPELVSDGAGGAIITWNGPVLTDPWVPDIYAQKVNANGSVLWTANGVAVCAATGEQGGANLVSAGADGAAGAFIAWVDNRSGVGYDIYANRIDAAGHVAPEVATLLQNYSAFFSESGIALTWTLSEIDKDVEFFIERSTASNGPFADLPLNGLIKDGFSFSFVDRNWEPNASYWYRVEYSTGSERKTLFESGPVTTPAMPLTLYQNKPNPFNPSTEIRYYLPEKCSVALDIYDVNGALVARLTEGIQDKGSHTVSWDGRDKSGHQVSSGVYFYRLKAGKTEISKKMVLTR